MNRSDLVLAAMAAAKGGVMTPIQTQKLLFLIDKKIPNLVGGPHFNFSPYHYGPFDKAVYHELEELHDAGWVELIPDRRWTSYRLSEEGQEHGRAILESLRPAAKDYLERASHFVRTQTFTGLVSAIYREFPEMRENSVFQG